MKGKIKRWRRSNPQPTNPNLVDSTISGVEAQLASMVKAEEWDGRDMHCAILCPRSEFKFGRDAIGKGWQKYPTSKSLGIPYYLNCTITTPWLILHKVLDRLRYGCFVADVTQKQGAVMEYRLSLGTNNLDGVAKAVHGCQCIPQGVVDLLGRELTHTATIASGEKDKNVYNGLKGSDEAFDIVKRKLMGDFPGKYQQFVDSLRDFLPSDMPDDDKEYTVTAALQGRLLNVMTDDQPGMKKGGGLYLRELWEEMKDEDEVSYCLESSTVLSCFQHLQPLIRKTYLPVMQNPKLGYQFHKHIHLLVKTGDPRYDQLVWKYIYNYWVEKNEKLLVDKFQEHHIAKNMGFRSGTSFSLFSRVFWSFPTVLVHPSLWRWWEQAEVMPKE